MAPVAVTDGEFINCEKWQRWPLSQLLTVSVSGCGAVFRRSLGLAFNEPHPAAPGASNWRGLSWKQLRVPGGSDTFIMCLLDFCYLLCSYFFESCVFLGESRWQREDFRCTKFTVPERFSVPVPCWKVIGRISTVVNDLFSIKHTSYKWYPVVLSYKEYFCHKVESASFYVPFIYLGTKKLHWH